MASQRIIEVFSAGCSVCEEGIALVQNLACTSCTVTVLDMHDDEVAARAKDLGISSVPAVVINGVLAACCAEGGLDEATLLKAGVGQLLT